MEQKAKPSWIRIKLPTNNKFGEVKRLLGENGLKTICEEAFCPNHTECWESGTATFLLMGDICTRACKFCDVKTGNPHLFLDSEEPKKLAQTVQGLGLKYAVLTSVDRDDLSDGGAQHLAQCIQTVKKLNPDILIEILIPDFQGRIESIKTILSSKPNVIGHNIETVERLSSQVRDKRASYKQSIQVLSAIKNLDQRIITKSSIMLGLGETFNEIKEALRDLKDVDVDIVTLGQYLKPTKRHLEVVEYIEPKKFAQLKEIGQKMGFKYVASGPLVRSSYCAGEFFIQNQLKYSQSI